MDRSPSDIHWLRHVVDRSAEDIEHPGNDLLSDWNPERSSCVLDRHAAGEPLCRGQRNSANLSLVQLGHNLDDDVFILSCVEHREYRRKTMIKANIDDTTAHGYHRAAIESMIIWLVIHLTSIRPYGGEGLLHDGTSVSPSPLIRPCLRSHCRALH